MDIKIEWASWNKKKDIVFSVSDFMLIEADTSTGKIRGYSNKKINPDTIYNRAKTEKLDITNIKIAYSNLTQNWRFVADIKGIEK